MLPKNLSKDIAEREANGTSQKGVPFLYKEYRMAKTTLTYLGVSPDTYVKLMQHAASEFTIKSTASIFSGDMKGGLIKMNGTYSADKKEVVIEVDHPFFVSTSQIQQTINNWLIAEGAPPTQAPAISS